MRPQSESPLRLGLSALHAESDLCRSYGTISQHSPHLIHMGLGEALILVDAENPLRYHFKAAASTESFLRWISGSSVSPAHHHPMASEIVEAYTWFLAMGNASPCQVRARPLGRLPHKQAEHVTWTVGIHKLTSSWCCSTQMATRRTPTPILLARLPPTCCTIRCFSLCQSECMTMTSHSCRSLTITRTVFAKAKAYTAEMSCLRGTMSVCLNELLLPLSDFAMLIVQGTSFPVGPLSSGPKHILLYCSALVRLSASQQPGTPIKACYTRYGLTPGRNLKTGAQFQAIAKDPRDKISFRFTARSYAAQSTLLTRLPTGACNLGVYQAQFHPLKATCHLGNARATKATLHFLADSGRFNSLYCPHEPPPSDPDFPTQG